MALKHKPSITAMAKPSCHPHHDSPDREEDKATEPELTDTDDDNSVNPDAAYKETKALGDADCEVSTHISSHFLIWHFAKAINTNHNIKCTADILTIFVRAKDYIHLDIGKADGHFCLVCRYSFFPKINAFCNILPRDKGVRQMAYFFSGGTSTLRTHCKVWSLSFHQLWSPL
jgi:hypothetical protein